MNGSLNLNRLWLGVIGLCLCIAGCAWLQGPAAQGAMDESSGNWQACKEMCLDRYPTTHGVEVRSVTADVVRCLCLRPRGDAEVYISVQQYSSEENSRVEEVLEP